MGAVAGGAGILTGNPILGGAGAGAIGAGGIMGLGAGAMQITGGVMQGLGGGGWHNALAGVVSLGTGVGISKLVQAPKGMTVHATASWNSKGSVVGNISGALAGLDEWFKPVQVDCSK